MIHVARGRLSKQIAGDIGIAEATVKVHRSRAMRKMAVAVPASRLTAPINVSHDTGRVIGIGAARADTPATR
jgi:FixJ family two-component response regulator